MNFIQFSFSNAYIYSPVTWLHKIQSNYKIFIIFSFLCLIPYITLSYFLIFTFSFLIIILTLKFHQNYYHDCFSILIVTLICILPYCFNNISYFSYKTFNIYIPYQIYNLFIFIKDRRLREIKPMNTKTFIKFKIPKFIIRIGIISILYSIVLKTLLLTTMYENIILALCMYIKIDHQYIKNTIFISLFASQFLEQTIKRIKFLYISIKLRNINLIICNNNMLVVYYLINKFLTHLKHDIYRVSSVLYIKEFSEQNFKIYIL